MTIAFVQHASATTNLTTGTTGTSAPTFAATAGAGNCLVACVSVGQNASSGPSVASVTTNGTAENWVLGATVTRNSTSNGDGYQTCAIWVNPNTGGGQKIIDCNISSPSSFASGNNGAVFADIYEFSGLVLSSVVDKTVTSSGGPSSTTFTSTATATLSQATEVAIGMAGTNGFTATCTITGPSSPWVNETTLTSTWDTAGVFGGSRSGYDILSATTAVTYSGTCTNADGGFGAVCVTLLGSTGVPITIPPLGAITSRQQAVRRSFSF